MSASITALAVCLFALGLFLLSVMKKRKLRAEFPLFFNYIALAVIMTPVAQICSRWFCAQYFYVYWVFIAMSMVLGFGVLYEVFVNILKPYSAVIDFGKMLFLWATLFLFLTSLTFAFATSGLKLFSQIGPVVQLIEHCIQLMQCGLLLLLLCFEKRLGLSWRSHGMCIALGLGTFAALDLAITYTNGRFPAWRNGTDLANGIVALGLFAFWTVGLMLPEAGRRTAQDAPTRIIMQRWNEALQNTPLVNNSDLSFSSIDSFIPGVERAVERILAKQMVE